MEAPALWPESRLTGASPQSWEFPAHPGICNAKHMLFGGWLLGALTEAAQQVTEASMRELHVGFVSAGAAGEVVDIDVVPVNEQGSFRHVRLTARVGKRVLVAGTSLLGPPAGADVSLVAPVVEGPGQYPVQPFGSGKGSGSSRLLEVRPITTDAEAMESHRALLWVRVKAEVDPLVAVAVASDFVPALVKRVLPHFPFVPTMTASLRVGGTKSGEWMLLDVELSATDALVASGNVRMWSSDGSLAATASQTCRLLSRAPGGSRRGEREATLPEQARRIPR